MAETLELTAPNGTKYSQPTGSYPKQYTAGEAQQTDSA